MRLINVHTKRIKNFYGDPTEPYAILSHTWGKEEEELSFQDMQRLNELGDGRAAKLDGCCELARKDKFKYVWIDTCCIDKTNAVELSEAITSMFRWYQKAAVCYTYLSDVVKGQRDQIGKSRWFTRGWTLQELLASRKITFYDKTWEKLGTKSTLSGIIRQATGIPHHILTGIASLQTSSIAQKLSWAAKRTTTRPEDLAYCLLGIFGIVIPPLYGEGLEAAFERLQDAIMKKTHDDSILAWSLGTSDYEETEFTHVPAVSGGILAASPAAFEGCGDIVLQSKTETRIRASETYWGTMPISICLSASPPSPSESSSEPPGPLVYGYLSCGPKSDPSLVVAIPLVQCHAESSSAHGPPVFFRPRGHKAVCIRKPAEHRTPETVLIRKDRARDAVLSDDKSYWLYLPGPYPWNANLEEVYPAEAFESEMAMIKTPKTPTSDVTLFLARFSFSIAISEYLDDNSECSDSSGDDELSILEGEFILGLEFLWDSAQGGREPRVSLYFDNPDKSTPLSKIPEIWTTLARSETNQLCLTHAPYIAIGASVGLDTIAGHCLWVVNLSDAALDNTHPINQPPSWPDISEQINLRTNGLTMVRRLRQGASLLEQRERYKKGLKYCDQAVNTNKLQLQDVAAQMAFLRLKTTYIEYWLKRQTGHQSMLNKKITELNFQLEGVDKALSSFRDIINIRTESREMLTSIGWKDQEPDWSEAERRERDGIVAHIMKQDPIKIDGVEVAWVPGITLPMYAAATGDTQLVKLALEYDDDIEAEDSTGLTVFDWAELARSEKTLEMLGKLRAKRRARKRKGERKPSVPAAATSEVKESTGAGQSPAGEASATVGVADEQKPELDGTGSADSSELDGAERVQCASQ